MNIRTKSLAPDIAPNVVGLAGQIILVGIVLRLRKFTKAQRPEGGEMKCPLCNGKGGFWDYSGEWIDCSLCNETGKVSVEKAAKFHDDQRRIDEAIEKEMKLAALEENASAKGSCIDKLEAENAELRKELEVSETCWKCGGEGFSHHDCGEDCCCCADPVDNVPCDICNGEGTLAALESN